MNKQFFVLVLISFFGFTIARTSEELRITLPNGSKLVGRKLRSHNGRSIKAFLGIPYAKPPIGHLRFKVIFIRINFEHEYVVIYLNGNNIFMAQTDCS